MVPLDVFPAGGAEHHIAGVALEAALSFSEGKLDLDLHRASARDTATGLLIRDMSARAASEDGTWTIEDLKAATEGSRVNGRLRFGNSRAADPIDIAITGAPLSLEEVSRYAPVLKGVVLAPTTTLSMKGRSNAFGYALDAASEAGAIKSEGRGSWSDAQFGARRRCFRARLRSGAVGRPARHRRPRHRERAGDADGARTRPRPDRTLRSVGADGHFCGFFAYRRRGPGASPASTASTRPRAASPTGPRLPATCTGGAAR
jgi:hypothetical protein